MGYPFFLSSLPEIRDGVPPTWTMAIFLSEAERNLSVSDYAVLQSLAENRPSTHPYVRAWFDFETQLRNACVRIRASRNGVDPNPFLHAHEAMDGSLDRRVQAAFQSPDPLSREHALNALRLEWLSSLPEDPFSLESVLAYFLRLRIAEQDASLNAEVGQKRLRALADQIPDFRSFFASSSDSSTQAE